MEINYVRDCQRRLRIAKAKGIAAIIVSGGLILLEVLFMLFLLFFPALVGLVMYVPAILECVGLIAFVYFEIVFAIIHCFIVRKNLRRIEGSEEERGIQSGLQTAEILYVIALPLSMVTVCCSVFTVVIGFLLAMI